MIQWSDDLKVNILSIDKQHEQLVKMIKGLDEAMRQGKGRENLTVLIKNLISYSSSHFKTEEDYFERFEYPEAGAHKKEHSEFAKKVNAFKEDFEKGNVGLSIQVMNFLCDWLKNHIKGSDRKYGAYLIAKGAS